MVLYFGLDGSMEVYFEERIMFNEEFFLGKPFESVLSTTVEGKGNLRRFLLHFL